MASVALGLLLLLQAAPSPLLRYPLPWKLGPSDVAGIERAAGGSVWMFSAGRTRGGRAMPTPESRPWNAIAMLAPDSATPRIRRGRYVNLRNPSTSEPPDASQWVREPPIPLRTPSWAQVSVPSRPISELGEPGSENWPFLVEGVFTDEQLVAIVDFVRTRPILTAASRGPKWALQRLPDGLTLASVYGSPTSARVGLTSVGSDCTDVVVVETGTAGFTATYTGGACG